MKEALYWEKQGEAIKCTLCPHNCIIKDNASGICGARKNERGTLYTLNYGRPSGLAIDPIEKKPLFHFLPGSRVMSFGTYGCNLFCGNCQNFSTSQTRDRQSEEEASPEKIVDLAIKAGCKGIAYTYNEPTIFFEYMLDTAKLARKKGLKNLIVSNGFINPEPLRELCKHIDAANIDLKSCEDKFYKEVCGARLEPVKETLRILKENGVWLEITNLIIPGLNDSQEDFKNISKYISGNLGNDVPLHFSRFFPLYKMEDKLPTPEKSLTDAKKIAEYLGLKHVYLGNVRKAGAEDTICSSCKKIIVKRNGFYILENHIKTGKCGFCGEKISGVWL